MKMHLNIAGAFSKFHILSHLEAPNNIKISVYDGVLHPWSGGRILKYNKKFSESIIRYYNNTGKKVFIALSNHYVDTQDSDGIKMLEFLDTTNNGVILCNPELKALIDSKYPDIETIYSITGHPNDSNAFLHCKELEGSYNLIVPRFEWIFNPEFLAIANTSKYEVMLNDTCVLNCKHWNDHFRAISKSNAMVLEGLDETQECWIPKFNPSIASKHACMDLTKQSILRCINLGYSHFKFSGRENSDSAFASELNRYIRIFSAL